MSSLDCGHNVSDLITIMANEVLMYTDSLLQNSINQIMKVMYSPFVVDNLLYSSYLNYSVKLVKVLSESL